MTNFGGFSGQKLRQYIQQVEKLENEKTEVAEYIKEVFSSAKDEGFDPKIMKQIIRIRKMKESELQQQEALLDTYMHALGMIVDDNKHEPEETELRPMKEVAEVAEDESVEEIEEELEEA